VWVSALHGEGIEALVERIVGFLPALERVRARLPLSAEAEAWIGEAYAEADVLRVDRGAQLEVDFEAPLPIAGSLAKRLRKLGGTAEPLGEAPKSL
jgi:50S ribosomal subunit-associated GTPase HflX